MSIDAITINDETHRANLIYLERTLDAIASGKLATAAHLLLEFAKAEHTRTNERRAIRPWVSIRTPHSTRENELQDQISALIARERSAA